MGAPPDAGYFVEKAQVSPQHYIRPGGGAGFRHKLAAPLSIIPGAPALDAGRHFRENTMHKTLLAVALSAGLIEYAG